MVLALHKVGLKAAEPTIKALMTRMLTAHGAEYASTLTGRSAADTVDALWDEQQQQLRMANIPDIPRCNNSNCFLCQAAQGGVIDWSMLRREGHGCESQKAFLTAANKVVEMLAAQDNHRVEVNEVTRAFEEIHDHCINEKMMQHVEA